MNSLKSFLNTNTFIYLASEILMGWVLYRLIMAEHKNALTLFGIFSLVAVMYGFYMTFKIDREDKIKEYKQEVSKNFLNNYPFKELIEKTLRKEYPQLTQEQRDELFTHLLSFLLIHIKTYSYFDENEFQATFEEMSEEQQKEHSYQEMFNTLKEHFTQDTPSLLLNRAWEIFSKTEEYQTFCEETFHNYLPYKGIIEEERTISIPNKKQNFSILWSEQCKREEIDPFFPQTLPSMFTIDERFSIKDGLKIVVDEKRLRQELSFTDAPTPEMLVEEIYKGVSSINYLSRKLNYYLNHFNYCSLHEESSLNGLFVAIEQHEELENLIYASQKSQKTFKNQVLDQARPDIHIGK